MVVGDLMRRLGESVGTLIGIEGHSTSGKTTLAIRLATVFDGACISTDNYIDRQSDAEAYSDRILVAKLLEEITRLRKTARVVFVEGICLRDSLRRVSIAPTTFIYCKRITQAGLWADDPLNYLDKKGLPLSTLSTVDRMSVEYHLRTLPLEKADIVYARQEAE